jgi:hypothetical protein
MLLHAATRCYTLLDAGYTLLDAATLCCLLLHAAACCHTGESAKSHDKSAGSAREARADSGLSPGAVTFGHIVGAAASLGRLESSSWWRGAADSLKPSADSGSTKSKEVSPLAVTSR